ncbi:MAG: phage head closure protein [Selenomonadaceae bacterium]|nr:phage head closure protein [Selenomonadaceae bacterium]
MYISLNELRQRIRILRPVTVQDEAGNLVEQGVEEVDTVWAKILPYAAKISDGYAEKVDEVNYRVVIRYRDDVEVTDQIQWRSHRFQITAPPYDFRCNRQYLVLEVRELVEDGQAQI